MSSAEVTWISEDKPVDVPDGDLPSQARFEGGLDTEADEVCEARRAEVPKEPDADDGGENCQRATDPHERAEAAEHRPSALPLARRWMVFLVPRIRGRR